MDGKTKKKKKDEQLVLDGDRGGSSHDDTICDSGSEVSDSVHSSDEEEIDSLIGDPPTPVDDNITVDFIINEDYCEEEMVPHLLQLTVKLVSF